MIYSPVLITVYNRLEHFKKCIISLSENYGAQLTDLYIAIDAPYRDDDLASNAAILDFCHGIQGFKSVTIIRREKNVGAHENFLQAKKDLFLRYDQLILSEDDNVFSSYFLTYINEGLEKYRNDNSVFAICGYTPPISINKDYGSDTYFSADFCPYGCGVWKNKFDLVDLSASDFMTYFLNPIRWLRFNKVVGDHYFMALVAAKLRNKIFPDVATGFYKYKNNMVSLLPVTSLVRNIGQDGSGLNSGVNEELQNQKIWSLNRTVMLDAGDVKPTASQEKNRIKYCKINPFKRFAIYVLYWILAIKTMIFGDAK